MYNWDVDQRWVEFVVSRKRERNYNTNWLTDWLYTQPILSHIYQLILTPGAYAHYDTECLILHENCCQHQLCRWKVSTVFRETRKYRRIFVIRRYFVYIWAVCQNTVFGKDNVFRSRDIETDQNWLYLGSLIRKNWVIREFISIHLGGQYIRQLIFTFLDTCSV